MLSTLPMPGELSQWPGRARRTCGSSLPHSSPARGSGGQTSAHSGHTGGSAGYAVAENGYRHDRIASLSLVYPQSQMEQERRKTPVPLQCCHQAVKKHNTLHVAMYRCQWLGMMHMH